MAFVAHITAARFAGKFFYVAAPSRHLLQAGPVSITFQNGPAFRATFRPWGGKTCLAIECPDLFTSNCASKDLPLRLGDILEYEVRSRRAVHILRVRRHTSSIPQHSIAAAPQTSGRSKHRMPSESKVPSSASGLTFRRLPPVPEYLTTRLPKIRQLGQQNLPPWRSDYDQLKHPLVEKLLKRFRKRVVTRANLIQLYTSWRDPAFCLIATMVWGGITIKNLKRLLGHSEDRLTEVMNGIKSLIRSGHLDDAFNACSRGGWLKLSGVDVSFFTKIFFFIGQTGPVIQPAPLIFDKWTMNAMFALARQACPQVSWLVYFTPAKNRAKPTEFTMIAKPKHLPQIYLLYVAWMNNWAIQIDVPVAKLEQFIFGDSRKSRTGKLTTNPRNELLVLAMSP